MGGDLLALASASCFAISNVTIARGAREDGDDNGAFVSLLLTTAISGVAWVAAGMIRGFEPVSSRALLWFAGAGVFTAYVGRVFFYQSVERLGAMRSSALKRLNPFFAVVLGVLVLREPVTGGMAVGLGLIAASFAVLVGGTGKWGQVTFPREAGARVAAGKSNLTPFSGYTFGVVSALGYSTGYLLRKMGLADAHDALLGAAVGCAVGAALFLVTAAFRQDYARAVRATFARPNPWLIGAGVMSSFGQILYFAALNESSMSRVALISSMEVFVTLFLGHLLLRKRERLTPALIVAAVLGVAGTAFVFGY